VRIAQIIYNPGGGVSGRVVLVNWLNFGMPETVVTNWYALGQKYRYDSPHVDIDVVWDDLTPETRSWSMAHRSIRWQLEEAFPALDED